MGPLDTWGPIKPYGPVGVPSRVLLVLLYGPASHCIGYLHWIAMVYPKVSLFSCHGSPGDPMGRQGGTMGLHGDPMWPSGIFGAAWSDFCPATERSTSIKKKPRNNCLQRYPRVLDSSPSQREGELSMLPSGLPRSGQQGNKGGIGGQRETRQWAGNGPSSGGAPEGLELGSPNPCNPAVYRAVQSLL